MNKIYAALLITINHQSRMSGITIYHTCNMLTNIPWQAVRVQLCLPYVVASIPFESDNQAVIQCYLLTATHLFKH